YMDLLTVEDVARILRVCPRRVRALVKQRNRQRTREALARKEVAVWIGKQLGRSGMWVFRPEEVELLRPGAWGRPKSK
ncbi:MAG: helix-turn-helix domain-containing protein, partial [Bacillota bacterium]|nr:helix-turn-helix domain-containing protein [Bacillota bacterium]